jgi:hypothetical protein
LLTLIPVVAGEEQDAHRIGNHSATTDHQTRSTALFPLLINHGGPPSYSHLELTFKEWMIATVWSHTELGAFCQ